MKQAITQEQYDELSDTARLRFVEWALGQAFEQQNYTHSYRTIGDLISFIDEYAVSVWKTLPRDSWSMTPHNNGWCVNINGVVSCEASQLCDALWEAIKFLLKKESRDE